MARSINAAMLMLALAACQQGTLDPGLSSNQQQQPQAVPLSATVEGEQVGNGPVRVALLLPKSASGGGGVAAEQMINAAKLAMRDFGTGRLQLVIKDTRGRAAEAQALTTQALREGATLILGPLFSATVSSATAVARPAQRPMISFTSDVNRAAPGVYLLSFPPQDDIARTIQFAASQGANRILAFLPNSAYGNVANAELQRLQSSGVTQIVGVHRYNLADQSVATAAIAGKDDVARANAIYIPAGGNVPTAILKELRLAGAALGGIQLLGSGQWETIDKTSRRLEGALYAGADQSSFQTFVERFQAAYGQRPTMTSALAYDAVSLASELVRRSPQRPFTAPAIQSGSGFAGATGLFRFRANGRIERGLAVYRIRNGSAEIVSPAPRDFRSVSR